MMSSEPTTTGTSRRALLLPGTLALVLAGLVTTCVVLWTHRTGGTDDGAVLAGRQEAVAFFSLDYRHADRDIERVLSQATGSFKTQYAAKRADLARKLLASKLVLTATAPADGSALEYLDGDTAHVLVAVDVTTRTGSRASTQSRYRTRVELTRVGDRWLTTAVNQVG